MQEQRTNGTPTTLSTEADFMNTKQSMRTSTPEISALVQTSTTPFSLQKFFALLLFHFSFFSTLVSAKKKEHRGASWPDTIALTLL